MERLIYFRSSNKITDLFEFKYYNNPKFSDKYPPHTRINLDLDPFYAVRFKITKSPAWIVVDENDNVLRKKYGGDHPHGIKRFFENKKKRYTQEELDL